MSQGVCYLLFGEAHRLPFLVSLTSLRRHYSGPVAIVTDQADWPRTIGVESIPLSADRQPGKFVHYYVKPRMAELSPFDSTVFLDLDTMIVDRIDDLFLPDGDQRIRAVQYADWTTNHTQMRHRLYQLAHHGIVNTKRAEAMMAADVPAINTGVFAFTKSTACLAEWQQTVPPLERFFVHDEIALQLILDHHPHDVFDDRWNCMPMFSRRRENVKIWHGPGNQWGRLPGWYDTLREIWDADFGGVRGWLKCNPHLWRPV